MLRELDAAYEELNDLLYAIFAINNKDFSSARATLLSIARAYPRDAEQRKILRDFARTLK